MEVLYSQQVRSQGRRGHVAQWIEHQIPVLRVGGSNPSMLVSLAWFCASTSSPSQGKPSSKGNLLPGKKQFTATLEGADTPYHPVFSPLDLLWALIGLLLTIGGTFLEASLAGVPLDLGDPVVPVLPLGVTWQVGAVLLIGSLGGRNAAAISQVAYLIIGLVWFNVFTAGGGLSYVFQPTFGYLLGFAPAAWLCGWLAFRLPRRLESLAFSNLCGLLTIHAIGLSYSLIRQASSWDNTSLPTLARTAYHYSILPLPGQLVLVCAVAVIAFCLRHLLLY